MKSIEETLFAQVRLCLALRDECDVSSEKLLFYDLGFTSLDLLDLLFRIEEEFGVNIVQGTLYNLARGELPESDFCTENILTPRGREAFMAILYDSPPAIFPENIHKESLPRFCTVGAFARLVQHKLNAPHDV